RSAGQRGLRELHQKTVMTPAPVLLAIVAAALATSYRWWPAPPAPTGGPEAGPAPAPSWMPRVDAAPLGEGAEGVSPEERRRASALGGGLLLAWGGLLVAPTALDLSYAVALAVYLVLAVGAVAFAVQSRQAAVAGAALGCGMAGGVSVALLSLAARPATFTALGALLVAFAGAALVSRTTALRALLACSAVALAAGLVGAAAAAAELAPEQAALALLAVPAAVALVAARLGRGPVALSIELTGAAAGLLAVALAAPEPSTLALVLGLCGVIAAGTALRAERRVAAGYLATALFVLAAWVRLAAWDVSAVEAYTLPVTVPALVVGAVRRRGDGKASSWTAYGPGLAATLLPSLFAAWGDEHWLRPLLLGVVALAVTLVGARLRLQALLVLGGSVLALDALHELAPYVVQVVGALPRWLPPALAGLLLLAVGATYEQRLRDARRLRETLGRMH
ncbi:hypothetical protein AB0M39_35735, partial [Streptomyces sp. NPDC051907]